MSRKIFRLVLNIAAITFSRRSPRRALSAAFKLCGFRVERRWPFARRVARADLNLGYDDILVYQFARSRKFNALVVGAFDGVANDPASDFIRRHDLNAVFIEPQADPFRRLQINMKFCRNVRLVNAAVDEITGWRDFYSIKPGNKELPAWTEQLASFDRSHLSKHEDRAPGLNKHIVTSSVETITFSEIIDKFNLERLDLLQVDVEGMDFKLLSLFPFERCRPAIVYYENAHMSHFQRHSIRSRLQQYGYSFYEEDGSMDDMAVIF